MSSKEATTPTIRKGRKRPRKTKNNNDRKDEASLYAMGRPEEGHQAPSLDNTTEEERQHDVTNILPTPELSPHTIRLLRLIRDGTSEHAEMAASQLHKITSPHNDNNNTTSVLLLWEIMGQLQSYLVSSEWTTRRNASIALEGVAQHLPRSDQRSFLLQQQQQQEEETHTTNGLKGQHWLTISNVQTNLETILS